MSTNQALAIGLSALALVALLVVGVLLNTAKQNRMDACQDRAVLLTRTHPGGSSYQYMDYSRVVACLKREGAGPGDF